MEFKISRPLRPRFLFLFFVRLCVERSASVNPDRLKPVNFRFCIPLLCKNRVEPRFESSSNNTNWCRRTKKKPITARIISTYMDRQRYLPPGTTSTIILSHIPLLPCRSNGTKKSKSREGNTKKGLDDQLHPSFRTEFSRASKLTRPAIYYSLILLFLGCKLLSFLDRLWARWAPTYSNLWRWTEI